MNTTKRRAASLKGWRTRKRMKAARQLKPGDTIYFGSGPALTHVLIVADAGSSAWPEYKRRALPLPDFGKVR